jgi:hypothetical protein
VTSIKPAATVVRELSPLCKRKACLLIELISPAGVRPYKLVAVEFLNGIDWFFVLRRIVDPKPLKTKITPWLWAGRDLLLRKKIFAVIKYGKRIQAC